MLTILKRFKQAEHAALYNGLDFVLESKMKAQEEFIASYGSAAKTSQF